ncbi:MAG: ATP-grasp domain-containing protein [Candidatus Glassbacteria bacterium]|nr:ATP-grasp domain-containing protein [Candidatus Glassbacteria bacterium]
MDDKRGIMIIGAGLMQVPLIEAARNMGLRTVVTDYNRESPGFALADVALEVSTRNIDFSVLAARRIAEQVPIHGVLTVGTDASRTVSAVAAALELPGIRYDVAERATDKIKMRQCFKDHGVPSPDFRYVWTRDETREALECLGLPAVIKPADNMGARGVKLLESVDQVDGAFTEARRASVSGMIIVEQFLEGPELSIDALVWDNHVEIVSLADRIIEGAPYFIERGHILPSELPEDSRRAACEVMIQGIRALGIDTGAAKGDIKLTPEGPKIGELAARLSGGFHSGFTYPLATGVDLMSAALRIAMGDPPGDLTPRHRRVAGERAIIPKPGLIAAVEGLDYARTLPGVKKIFTMYQAGDIYRSPTCNMGKFGNIIAVADTRAGLEEVFRRTLAAIKITAVPEGTIPIEDSKDRQRAHRLHPVGTGTALRSHG